jgi:hypothetical protein
LLFSCGGNTGSGSIYTQVEPTRCQCCSNPASCDLSGGGNSGTDTQAGLLTNAALANLSSAKALTDPAPNQYAAKAVDMSSKTAIPDVASKTSTHLGDLTGHTLGRTDSTSGGSGGAANGSGAGGANGTGLLGDTSTKPAAVSPTEPTMATNTRAADQYASTAGGSAGGRGGSGGSGSNPFSGLFGGGGDSIPSGNKTADSVSFSGARDLASVNPTGSSDPADYFSRIGADDNLFKVVERRYQKETMAWTSLGLPSQLKK